jgi:hexosaminidase
MWVPGIPIYNNTIGMNWYGWVGNLAGISDWRSAFSRITAANKNGILAGRWYLGMEPNPQNKSLPRIHPDWKVWYKTDPHDFDGTPSQKKLILGGMGTIWSDLVKLDIFNRSWPLMNSIGEQLWTSRNITIREINNFTIQRYEDHAKRLIIKLGKKFL